MISFILTDIEGTTTPIAFVHDVLFPFSKKHLDRHAPDAETAARLRRWIEEDRKEPELKELQGRIWREGYESGELVSDVYPDVKPALTRWQQRGLGLGIYSSGSVEAQKLLFRYTSEGDLTPFFGAYFDTKVGAKRETDAYRKIAAELRRPASEILFLSDVEAELDAAQAAGMRTLQIVRPGTVAGRLHATARSFEEVPADI